MPVFERLTQKIEHASPKLREFVQKKDPVVCEADLTGSWEVSPAHKWPDPVAIDPNWPLLIGRCYIATIASFA